MPGEAPLRLFVACPMSEDVKSGLTSIQDDLRRQGAPRLRWVRPEGIHITLKFLGAVEPHRVDAIGDPLASAINPFELRLSVDRLGGFGGARLRVIWAGLAGDKEQLASLAGRVDVALQPLGFASENRPFAPHITLARAPDEMSSDDRRGLAGLVEAYKFAPLPPMIVTEVLLIRSILGPGGSKYEHLVSFPTDRGKNA
jgi:RNA 2',3'-cyclic 3'-phosphodiesterase